MELSLLLHRLQLSSSAQTTCPTHSDAQPFPPITQVFTQLQEKLIEAAQSGNDSEITVFIGQVEQLFKIADPHWLLPPEYTIGSDEGPPCDQWAGLKKAYVDLVLSLTLCASLPVFEMDSCLPDNVYRNVTARALPVCSALCTLLGRLGSLEHEVGGFRDDTRELVPEAKDTGLGTPDLLVAAVAPLCCVFAVTHFQEQPWTEASTREAAGSLLRRLLTAGGWSDVPHLLMGEDCAGGQRSRGMFEGVLDVLQPNLTKDRLHQCAAVKLVFSWALLQITRPFLSPRLPRLLPPSLLLSDHYRPENCILGIRCLHHIVLQTPAADLRQYNRAEVVYQALYKHLYTSNAPQIQLVLDCLLDLLLVLERSPSLLRGPSPRNLSRHDNVLCLLLTNMEMEHKVALRRVYAAALPKFIDRMGVSVCRHLRRTERVVLGYLEVSDPPQEQSRTSLLDAVERLLPVAWPRMEHRVNILLQCLLRLLVDVTSDRFLCASVKEKLTNQTSRCLTLLNHCSQGRIQPLLHLVDGSCASADVLRCLATVTTATER